jgi:hypothetical protein
MVSREQCRKNPVTHERRVTNSLTSTDGIPVQSKYGATASRCSRPACMRAESELLASRSVQERRLWKRAFLVPRIAGKRVLY